MPHKFRPLGIGLGLALFAFAAALAVIGGYSTARAAADPVVWVNDTTYGSAGKGFYHDFVSGTVWTSERGWHLFSPAPARAYTAPLWVNYLAYGSAGGGFYLDTVSGQVWTAERGWHNFDPRPTQQGPAATQPKPVASQPQQAPRVAMYFGALCVGYTGCPNGPNSAIRQGDPITASFAFNVIPTEVVSAELWFGGIRQFSLTADDPPYSTSGFNTKSSLGFAPGPGSIVLIRLFVGGKYIDAFSATVAGSGSGFTSPSSPATPFPTPYYAPQPTPTPYYSPPPGGSGVRIGAVCNDGWVSTATGSGACSHHGGVAYWLTN